MLSNAASWNIWTACRPRRMRSSAIKSKPLPNSTLCCPPSSTALSRGNSRKEAMALRILAIDGGGIRGYFAAHVLERIQQEHGVHFANPFDVICGTSTGAIIAAALATEYPLKNVKKLYEERGCHIFKRATGSIGGLLRAKYSIARLRSELSEAFGDQTLTQTTTRLLIPATDIGNGQVHVFKSAYSSDFVR